MANASAKRIAAINQARLDQLHLISLAVVLPALLLSYLGGRSLIFQLLMSSPGFASEYFLEKWCRPKLSPKKTLISPGVDYNQRGVIEYMRDVVYLTWTCLLGTVAIGSSAWALFIVLVPGYAAFKGVQVVRSFMQLFKGQRPEAVQM